MTALRSLDVIIPVYNEADCINSFNQLLSAQLDKLKVPYHVIYVNDGSQDNTQALLSSLAAKNKLIRVLELSRNFGHQAAITCGLDHSTAEWVLTMDGDGEHPPEKIPEMIGLAEQGYDLIQVKREAGQQASWLKRVTSDLFYKLIREITSTPILPGVGDFRLMNRLVVDAIVSMPEHHRFLRGMVAWLGFRTAILNYVPAPRLGGRSKYSIKKMFRLGVDAIYSFSLAPIIACMVVSLLFLISALVTGIIGLIQLGQSASWHPGLVSLLLFCTGVILFAIGSVGYYSGMTFQQVKWRPLYLVRSVINEPPVKRNKVEQGK